jgi:hypothetical protein
MMTRFVGHLDAPSAVQEECRSEDVFHIHATLVFLNIKLMTFDD